MTDEAVLADFVRQSNTIEGEPTEPGHPLFDDHLLICRQVALGGYGYKPETLLRAHGLLLRSQPKKFPGEYRQCGVWVGGQEKMDAVEVRRQMPELGAHLRVGPRGEDAEKWTWDAHHWFEHIHPFIDGNGRTGRILLNILRLRHGLPWLTVGFEDRFAYYRSIEDWERGRR